MKLIDQLYQTAVDKEADKILTLSVDEFLKIKDYGNIDVQISGKKIPIGFYRRNFNGEIPHLVFQTDRRVFLIAFKKYLSGVKLENGKLLKLTDEEICVYD